MSVPSSAASSRPDVPTSLYLYYDKYNVLLYVGVTHRGIKRNHEHSDKNWWQYVARQEVTHLPSRVAALKAERETIIRRSPPFNRAHNPGHDELAVAYHRFFANAEDLRRVDAQSAAKPVQLERKVKPVKKAQPNNVAPTVSALPQMSECTLLPLDLVSRDGKFLRCRSRFGDSKFADALNLTGTRFDRFRVGMNVGSVMSLARIDRRIELRLKGSWFGSVIAVSAVTHRGDRGDRLIHTLQLVVGDEVVVADPLGISGQPNIGKFSNSGA